MSRLWLGTAPPAPASPAFGHGESRESTRRVAQFSTASPAFQHGESRESTRRVAQFSTASPASGHAGPCGARPDLPGPAADLAARQAALIVALVAGGPDPAGFDPARLAATRQALLRKRAGESERVWPALAASFGADWPAAFAAHHAGRAPVGALREGWDLARDEAVRGALADGAAVELAEREAAHRYDGHTAPRPRTTRARRWAAAALLRR